MPRVLVLLLLLSFTNLAQAGKKDPEWLVKVETTTPEGETIVGTGYIVQIGEEFFVRTASHVTLGSENVELKVKKKRKLKVVPGEGLTDNYHDDQLVRIENPGVSPLGIYSKNLKAFVIPPEAYETFQKSKRKKNVEQGIHPQQYLIPSWVRKNKDNEYKEKRSLGFNNGTRFYDGDKNKAKISFDHLSYSTKTDVKPGESGSPLTSEVVSMRGQPVDMHGNYIEYKIKNSSGYIPIIAGHAQTYSRFFHESRFSTPEAGSRLVEMYLEGRRGSSDDTIWKRRNGVFFREISTPEGIVREANWNNQKAGNGVGGNGGNGVGGNGGNGVGGNGGNGVGGNGGNGVGGNGGNGVGGNGGNGDSEELPADGMVYNGVSTNTLILTVDGNKQVLYASWDNFRYINLLKEKLGDERVSAEAYEGKISELIQYKASLSPTNINHYNKSYEVSDACKYDLIDLEDGILQLKINGFEPVAIDLNAEDFFPILKVKRERDEEILNLDIRGLYSIDIAAINSADKNFQGLTEFEYYQSNPFIVLGSKHFEETKIDCTGFTSLVYFEKAEVVSGNRSNITKERSGTTNSPNSSPTGSIKE